MRSRTWIAGALVSVVGVAWGCSGSDTSTLSQQGTGGASAGAAGSGASAGSAGHSGAATGGSSGAGIGGSSAGGAGGSSGGGTGGTSTGGSSTGGASTGGASTGGAAGSGGVSGTGGSVASYWPSAYDPAGKAAISSGEHNAGKDCLNCHTGAGEAPAWLFAGTIYDSTGKAPLAHVEVAVKDPGGFYSAYSANNGNFWVPNNGSTLDWGNAEVRARDANGELTMSGTAAPGCNSCHGGMPITAP